MDSDFLEFWGNLLINTAKGRRKMEEINQWINQGLKGSDELSNMILSFYGIQKEREDPTPDGETLDKVSKAFLDSYHEYIQVMGMVPRTEYEELSKNCEKLEKKCAEQEETIEFLKGLISDRIIDPSNTVENFQELLSKQSEQFRRLMLGFNKALNSSGNDIRQKK
jgi:hypothetical protein